MAARKKQRCETQYEPLKASLLAGGEPLVVTGATGLPSLTVLYAFFLLVAYVVSDQHHFFVLLILVPFLILLVFYLASACYVFGKPKLILSREGVWTPWLGQEPWEAISGMDFRERHNRMGKVVAHELVLQFMKIDIPAGIDRLARLNRHAMRFRKNRLYVRLALANEPPELVHQLASDLWALGRREPEPIPNPRTPMDDLFDQLQHLEDMLENEPESPEKALREVEALNALTEKMRAETTRLKMERRRHHRRIQLAGGVLLILLIGVGTLWYFR